MMNQKPEAVWINKCARSCARSCISDIVLRQGVLVVLGTYLDVVAAV